jgi:hypothetical protein
MEANNMDSSMANESNKKQRCAVEQSCSEVGGASYNRLVLSPNITLLKGVDLSHMDERTIGSLNDIVRELKPEDPALVVQLGSEQAIHASLQVLHSPVPAGITPQDSSTAFRQYLIDRAHTIVSPNHQVGGVTALVWQELSNIQHIQILNTAWLNIPWCNELLLAHLGGTVATVYVMTGEGRHCGSVHIAPQIFG